MDLNGEITLHAMVTDVTELSASEESLEKSQEKLTLYREIFVRSGDAIAVLDPQGVYQEQNDAHRTLIGYSDSYLRGRTPSIQCLPEGHIHVFD